MSNPPASIPGLSNSTPGTQERPGYRTKTIATRITPEELAEIETAAERSGETLAEWLRELALKSARQQPADPMELLLSEVAATRYLLLNLFHATAQANAEGKHLIPESVLKIRETADNRKLGMARKLLADFFAGDANTEGANGGKG
jgi:uncharacterized protein (DUF1778 family)